MKKITLLLMLSALFIMSCKSDKKEEKDTEPAATEETVETKTENTATTNENADAVTLEIEGDDQMKFNKSEFKVKAGQKVTLVLKHVGEMDKSVMGHNWVLLKPGTDIPAFAEKAIAAKDNDYIPADTDAIVVHTKLLGGGEETSITFDAPAAGTYDFICSFPGHYSMMNGKFIVE
ncbi:MAG: azurin [Flavobacteriales bacterium]|nr:MAG: azurin [Flavobacteriales bacterium]